MRNAEFWFPLRTPEKCRYGHDGMGGCRVTKREVARPGRAILGRDATQAASGRKPPQVIAAIDVDHLAGAVWQRARHQRRHRLADVLWRAPAADRRQPVGAAL